MEAHCQESETQQHWNVESQVRRTFLSFQIVWSTFRVKTSLTMQTTLSTVQWSSYISKRLFRRLSQRLRVAGPFLFFKNFEFV